MELIDFLVANSESMPAGDIFNYSGYLAYNSPAHIIKSCKMLVWIRVRLRITIRLNAEKRVFWRQLKISQFFSMVMIIHLIQIAPLNNQEGLNLFNDHNDYRVSRFFIFSSSILNFRPVILLLSPKSNTALLISLSANSSSLTII